MQILHSDLKFNFDDTYINFEVTRTFIHNNTATPVTKEEIYYVSDNNEIIGVTFED